MTFFRFMAVSAIVAALLGALWRDSAMVGLAMLLGLFLLPDIEGWISERHRSEH